MTAHPAAAVPGRYAKFLTAVLGQFLVYLQIYGWVWEPKAAATMGAIALGVLAVPNTPKPVPPAGPPAALASNVTLAKPLSDAEVAQIKQDVAERLAQGGSA